jgi:hypothetical protein
MIGNFHKGFPFRSKTIYERCFLACPAPNYGNGLFGAGRKRAVLRYIYRLLAIYVSLLANIGVL